MISLKPSIKQSPNTKILILDISSEGNRTVQNNRFKAHKLRRFQSLDQSKNIKATKLLEKFDFKNFLSEKLSFQPIPISFQTPKNRHQSSYLLYKEEQRFNKVKHSNKIAFLRNKTIQHPQSVDSKMKCKNEQMKSRNSYNIPLSKRKMSLVVLGQSFYQKDQNNSSLGKSRNIYMKTSQGKRQKIDPRTYLNKIKQKIQILTDCESTNHIFELSSNYLQSDYDQIPMKINPFNIEKHHNSRKMRPRNFKKQLHCFKNEDGPNECRPWTSRKSEVPQQ